MSLGLTYPHIQKTEGAPACLERLPRVRVAQVVMDHIAHGWSAEEICRQHSHLLPVEVYASLAYYFDHQEEMHREIQAEWELAERARAEASPTPFVLRMKAQEIL